MEQRVEIVSDFGGAPIEGVSVQIDDSAWVNTDADGIADISGVEAPFTVRAHHSVRNTPTYVRDVVWELDEQTENPLTLRFDGYELPERHHASLSGTVVGFDSSPTREMVLIAHGGAQPAKTWAAGEQGEFEMPFEWEGPPSHTIQLEAFGVDIADSGAPVRFTSHGSIEVALSDPDGLGAVVDGLEIADLGPVTEELVSGTVEVPEGGGTFIRHLLAIELADGSRADFRIEDRHLAGAFEFAYPAMDGATPIVGFVSDVESGVPDEGVPFARSERRLSGPASGVALELPVPVEQLEPDDGASVDRDATFRWEPQPDAAATMLRVNCEGGERDTSFEIVRASAAEARLPGIPGIDLRGQTCTWRVGWFNRDALDELVTGARTEEPRSSHSSRRSATIR